MRNRVGIIGFGNMGSAIAGQLKSKYEIWAFDKDRNKINNLSGINTTGCLKDLVGKVDTVILAVKPQDFDLLLNEIKDFVQGKLILSIAAGITTNYIERHLKNVRIVRLMPNVPAKIGKAMTCISKGRFANEEDLDYTKRMFDNLGNTLVLSEDMMDAATAISGSGPAYVCQFLESKGPEHIHKVFWNDFREAATSVGFSSQEAEILVSNTISGTLTVLKEKNILAQDLIKQVTSKGGTTQAALEILHKGGSLKEAVKAAKKRAEELSKKE